jgi:hypothetical protein
MAAISLVLYVTSFFNARWVGISTIIITSVFIVTLSALIRIKQHRTIKDPARSSGLIFMLIIIFAISAITYRFSLSTWNWDEYSHWALVLKNLYLSNNFGNLEGSTTLFKYYPQGVSLFQSFTTSFSNHFSESSALAGLLVLSYAQMITVFTTIKHTDWKKIIAVSGLLFITPFVFFDSFLSTMCADAVIALIFANVLFFNFSYSKKDLFYTIYMSLQFYLLVNTKQIGIVLAIIAFSAILVDQIVSNNPKPIKAFLKREKNKLMLSSLPMLAGYATYVSWKYYISGHNIPMGFSSPTLSDLLNIFSSKAPSYLPTTTVNFVHHFFSLKQYGVFNLSFFLWSILLIMVIYYVHRLQSNRIKKSFSFQLIIAIGLYLYAGIILIMYFTAFTEYESTNVASFDRYIGTYFLSLLVVALLLLIDYITKSKPPTKHLPSDFKIILLIFILLCLIPTNYLVDNTILQKFSNSARRASREPYEDMRQYEKILNREKDRVFVISQNTTGLDFYILKYNFTPIQTQQATPKTPNVWSLGKPYSSEDQWTIDLSPEEWAKTLENFTYVYLYNIDDRFISDYGKLFKNTNEIKSKSIYRVDKIRSKIILERLASIKDNA